MSPRLSVVVVAHGMDRELPRTLRTLATPYQRGIEPDDYEVIVVDNGSSPPVAPEVLEAFAGPIRSLRLDPAPPSPARAANLGIEAAEGRLVGLIVDGARMASPGLLATALAASGVAPRPVIATLGWHLGSVRHMDAASAGHDQAAEDALLDGVDWETDGYRLFEIATLGGSSAWGWFSPLAESSALFLPAPLWGELGGLDEGFARPGGGLVNHDLYRRASELGGVELVTLLGEGTFHQFHGGASTSGGDDFEQLQAEYIALRGTRYLAPTAEPLLIGRVPPSVQPELARSVELAEQYRQRQRKRLR
jgi:hypothetical protein